MTDIFSHDILKVLIISNIPWKFHEKILIIPELFVILQFFLSISIVNNDLLQWGISL